MSESAQPAADPPAPAPAAPASAAALPAPVQARNVRLVQVDSLFVGVVSAAGTFLPVFLVRLGANGTEVGLLSALSALAAVSLAIPAGRWLQRRGDIVWWYSRLRGLAWTAYVLMGLTGALLPAAVAVPVILAIWGLSAIPGTAGLVAFPIVMDGVAGASGRIDVLGRRWALAGVATAVAVAVAGQALDLAAFPGNFAWLMAAFSLAGLGSLLVSRRFVVPAHHVGRAAAGVRGALGLGELVRTVRGHRSFLGFEARSLAYTAALGLAMPLVPLYYVHEVHAPDAWIGVIAAAQSVGQVAGYAGGRRLSRGRGGAGILVPSMLAGAAVPAAFAAVGWLPAVAALAFVAGLAAAGSQLALFDSLMSRLPREHNLTFVSVDQTLQNLALIVAPSVGGVLAVGMGVRAGLVVTATVGLVAAVLFALERRATRRGAA